MSSWVADGVVCGVAVAVLLSGCGRQDEQLTAAREEAVSTVAGLPWLSQEETAGFTGRVEAASSVEAVGEVSAEAWAVSDARDGEYWSCRSDAGFSTSGYPLTAKWVTAVPGSGGQDVVQLWIQYGGSAKLERVEGVSAAGVSVAPDVSWIEQHLGKVVTRDTDFNPMTIEKRVEKLDGSPAELLESGVSCSMPFKFSLWVEIGRERHEKSFRAWMRFSMQDGTYSLVLTDPDSGERVAEFSRLKDS